MAPAISKAELPVQGGAYKQRGTLFELVSLQSARQVVSRRCYSFGGTVRTETVRISSLVKPRLQYRLYAKDFTAAALYGSAYRVYRTFRRWWPLP